MDSKNLFVFQVPKKVRSWQVSPVETTKSIDTTFVRMIGADSVETLEAGYFSNGSLEYLKFNRSGYQAIIHKAAESNDWLHIEYERVNDKDQIVNRYVVNEFNQISIDRSAFWRVSGNTDGQLEIEVIHTLADSVHLSMFDAGGKEMEFPFQLTDESRGQFRCSIKMERGDTITGLIRHFKTPHDLNVNGKEYFTVGSSLFKYPNDYQFESVENQSGTYTIVRKGIYGN